MNAGILREQIEIYEPVVEKTQTGASRTTWNLFYTTRANVRYNSGNVSAQNNEVVYNTYYRFIVRHYVPVTEKMRIKYNDHMYKITSIEPNKYYNDKEILCDKVNT